MKCQVLFSRKKKKKKKQEKKQKKKQEKNKKKKNKKNISNIVKGFSQTCDKIRKLFHNVVC